MAKKIETPEQTIQRLTNERDNFKDRLANAEQELLRLRNQFSDAERQGKMLVEAYELVLRSQHAAQPTGQVGPVFSDSFDSFGHRRRY